MSLPVYSLRRPSSHSPLLHLGQTLGAKQFAQSRNDECRQLNGEDKKLLNAQRNKLEVRVPFILSHGYLTKPLLMTSCSVYIFGVVGIRLKAKQV